ncbi:MAG: hypothetical protein ACD_7C00020G0003 [uncultured bacterium]|nr:MAG: hypothetical protein ACD_7C00020G0003 [uncultured bacterium]KKP67805.1 MAG: hypothetical protein UR66_C0010G0043 [Candidatus Moranbacteria bacterium GW2011_GWE1_35_17]KKP83881.1 MAG: hypothetical protein UR82_C0017G0011 [Candidatus Moranbacteria bacterium GW2011_GWF1_35_5]KKP83943.1 MAG: hypothetical protein UR83_C0030G0027 [Candidatus Moranbacteria bacterium GW2011_GWF2_35_54]HBR79860.1 hypothetical protein [Candidatus Moranbacteria bacterium]
MNEKEEIKSKIMIEDEIVLLTTRTLHDLFRFKKNGADAVSLYCFYYYTAKWQKTNQIKATDQFCIKGLGWGRDKFTGAKRILEHTNLIQKIMIRRNGKIARWYIKLNYIWTTKKAEEVESMLIKKECDKKIKKIIVEEIKNAEIQQVENTTIPKQPTNAYSANKENTLSANKENTLSINKSIEGITENNSFQPSKLCEFFEKILGHEMPDKIIPILSKDGLVEVNQNLEAGKRLIKKYGTEKVEQFIKLFFDLKKEVSEDKRKYIPAVGNMETFEEKLVKILDFIEKQGVDPHTGKRYKQGGPHTSWEESFKGELRKDKW